VEILKRFETLDYKAISTLMVANLKLLCDTTSETVDATIYRKMIGLLMYLMNTRQDICFAVNTLSQYMVEPRHLHLIVEKHVMMYLKSTIDYGLKYILDHEIRLQVCTNLDWERSATERKSTSRYCFNLGSIVISWLSKK
jgi:hypothetical protein